MVRERVYIAEHAHWLKFLAKVYDLVFGALGEGLPQGYWTNISSLLLERNDVVCFCCLFLLFVWLLRYRGAIREYHLVKLFIQTRTIFYGNGVLSCFLGFKGADETFSSPPPPFSIPRRLGVVLRFG